MSIFADADVVGQPRLTTGQLVEAMWTIRPSVPALTIYRATTWEQRKKPVRLTFRIFCQSL